MAKSLKTANSQIEKLKQKLLDLQEKVKASRAPRATMARVRSAKNLQKKIDAANAAIEKAKAILDDPKKSAKTKAAAKERIAKLKAMITSIQKAAKPLTVYNVRILLDEKLMGTLGPYATIRAASADAKNVLRMHVGPDYQIEEIGIDEPVLRSDGEIMAYFHPSIYTSQGADKGVLTAQVVETGGEAERRATFVDALTGALAKPKKKKATAQVSLLPNRRRRNPELRAPRSSRMSPLRLTPSYASGLYVISGKTGNVLSGPWHSEEQARAGAYGTHKGVLFVWHEQTEPVPRDWPRRNPELRAPRSSRSSALKLHPHSPTGIYTISGKTGNVLAGPWHTEEQARAGGYGTHKGVIFVHHTQTESVPRDWPRRNPRLRVEGEDRYRFTHGKRPSGRGHWMFADIPSIDFRSPGYENHLIQAPGFSTYTEAKNYAISVAADRGFKRLYVLT